jgi:hypothetical protein
MQAPRRVHAARSTRPSDDERGLTTAELLGNAALGIVALLVIWGALTGLGEDIVDWIRSELLGG